MPSTLGSPGRGRPLTFDRGEAVDRAMKLFWDRGYEGTSYDALLAAMGVSASSFQHAFGSKEELFREALEFYGEQTSRWFSETLQRPGTAHAAFAELVAFLTSPLAAYITGSSIDVDGGYNA